MDDTARMIIFSQYHCKKINILSYKVIIKAFEDFYLEAQG